MEFHLNILAETLQHVLLQYSLSEGNIPCVIQFQIFILYPGALILAPNTYWIRDQQECIDLLPDSLRTKFRYWFLTWKMAGFPM